MAGEEHPSCARKASSQLYRHRHRYRSLFRAARRFTTTSGFGDSSYRSSSSSSSNYLLWLFMRYLLLQQLLQWVFCGNGNASGNCGPYICMVASWTTGTVVLNHSRRHISTATATTTASIISSSSSPAPTSRTR